MLAQTTTAGAIRMVRDVTLGRGGPMSGFEAFKIIHILAAMAWFGGDAYSLYCSRRLIGAVREDPRTALRYANAMSESGNKYFIPAVLTTLLAGVIMVFTEDAYSFGDAWIVMGLGGIALGMVVGVTFALPRVGRLIEVLETDPVDANTVDRLSKAIRHASHFEVTMIIVVVFAMVTRPGA